LYTNLHVKALIVEDSGNELELLATSDGVRQIQVHKERVESIQLKQQSKLSKKKTTNKQKTIETPKKITQTKE
jgi:hypothetical protein